jgi:putative copper export protein
VHTVWVWLHLLGAALWLGGVVFLGVLVIVAYRALDRPLFRQVARLAGRAFAGLSVVAWLLILVSGLALATEMRWPRLIVEKTGLAVLVVIGTAVHVVTGMRTESRTAITISRSVGVLVLLGTLVIFWIGVRVAES